MVNCADYTSSLVRISSQSNVNSYSSLCSKVYTQKKQNFCALLKIKLFTNFTQK